MAIRKALPGAAHLLVAVDFSDCSRRALRRAAQMILGGQGRMIVLHVVDQRFVQECIRRKLAEPKQIKENLFIDAKNQLKQFLQEEGLNGDHVKPVICEGFPHQEIARQAEKFNVDMVVMGSCGMVGDTEAIFFGGTAEKVLRFISRPVLCVPPTSEMKGLNYEDERSACTGQGAWNR
jgi:nucleotide-binding universal stress UspA family protein